MLAIPAFPVHTANPRNSHSRADGKLRRLSPHNFTNDLVPGGEWLTALQKLAFNNMQVRAAHTARPHPKKDFPSGRS